MTAVETIETNPENLWRLETPGDAGWARTARPGAQARKKYFMVSCDTHLQAPVNLFKDRIDEKFHHLLPRMEMRDGVRFMVNGETGQADRLVESELSGEDMVRSKAGAAFRGDSDGFGEFTALERRIADHISDGVDAEIIFPNGPALLMFAGRNAEFIDAQCRAWNDWSIDYCRPHVARCYPTAAIPAFDIDFAIAEVHRAARLGFRILTLPNKPFWGPDDPDRMNYNHKEFDRLWAVIQDHDLPITFHAATGKDPRAVKGPGGAVINYALHGCLPVAEPAAMLCASGAIERFPKMRFAVVEGNAGWLPWMLDMMDEAFKKHHFWTRPKLKELPSTYFRTNGAATLTEDRSALLLCEPYGLEDNLLWANDYPHHEGTWPHSAEAIEREMGHLKEATRAKILGLNAARIFGIEVPAELR